MKTKLVSLALVAGIVSLPAQQQQDPPPIMTFMEGICVGLVIGVAVDVVIVVGVNCVKKWRNTPNPEPPPPWVITNSPPSVTNSITNQISGVLNASNSVTWYRTSYGAGFDTTVEAKGIQSDSHWTPILLVRGWQTPSALMVRLSAPDGTPIVTNWIPGAEPYALFLPANLPSNTLYRTTSQ